MSLKDAAAREAVLKTLLDVVEDAYTAARAETQNLLDAAAKESGTRQVGVTLPDGPEIATVSLSSGRMAAKVTDDDEFTAWVRDNFDGEIERRFVTQVREAFREKVLAELTAAGSTEWVDKETGTVHQVPGVDFAPARARYHSVRFKEKGREQVMQAWREGSLGAMVLNELSFGQDQ